LASCRNPVVRVLLCSWAIAVAVALLLVPMGCGSRADGPPKADKDETAQTRPDGRGDGDLRFVPAMYREGDRIVLPVTFLDGTSAELVYPPELEIAELGVFPYSSGRLPRETPTPQYGEVVGRDFLIRHGDLERVLALLNNGTRPALIARYEGADGDDVGLWDLRTDDTANYLGFQFGDWAVLVYDYERVGPAMTDPERAAWSANFSRRETGDGFLILEGSGPLRLAHVSEHAGPELDFSDADAKRGLELYPSDCRPHRHQTQVVDGKLVQWSRGFANWCLSDSMRIHASGSNEFVGALIRELEVRNVTIAKS
jgi:hypothetical protein